ncbi:MAG TPA: DNA methylase, partial [bacterium]|nr:DNA methylase [bacterium]
VEKVWNKTFILKEKEFLKVAGPDERNIEELYSSKELIDVLHLSLLLWQKNDDLGMKKVLSSTGFGLKDTFYKVAQAISETLPITSREKKLLDGFLSGKSRITKEIKEIDEKKEKEQQKLF